MQPQPVQIKRDTLLVVDDEKDTVELAGRLFRDAYHVITAISGAEALKKIQDVKVTVALVDQRMPNMTGAEFFSELSVLQPRAGRVAMTGYTDLEAVVALVNNGHVNGFILKPWENHSLRLLVQREVDLYRKTLLIDELNEKLKNEHANMLAILRELDPSFDVPENNDALKDSKQRLRQRVADEVERMFLAQLLTDHKGNMSAVARQARINRTFLYKLLKRHNLPYDEVE